MKKTLTIVGLTCLLWTAGSAAETNRYPNEATGYVFYPSATWRTLTPLKSTMAEVRKVLGAPTNAKDLADYNAPYPGDEKAVQPVWTYDLNDKWKMLVYFVKSKVPKRRLFDRSLYDTLLSIEYISKQPIPFDLSKLPSVFVRSHTVAADAAWNEYADGSGLVYEVYTCKTPYGGHVAGDLNRITYGPPKELVPNQQKKRR